jgi:hypothetical protein
MSNVPRTLDPIPSVSHTSISSCHIDLKHTAGSLVTRKQGDKATSTSRFDFQTPCELFRGMVLRGENGGVCAALSLRVAGISGRMIGKWLYVPHLEL